MHWHERHVSLASLTKAFFSVTGSRCPQCSWRRRLHQQYAAVPAALPDVASLSATLLLLPGAATRASAGGCVLCCQPRIVSTRVVHGQGASTTSLGVPINRAAEEGGVRASCSPDADKEAVGLDALPDVGAPLHRLQWRVRAHLVVWPGAPELHRLRLHYPEIVGIFQKENVLCKKVVYMDWYID